MSDKVPIEHLTVAEVGKTAALRGDFSVALNQYREAMRLAIACGAPEVFFRHYLEATLEALELMGEYSSVLEYCERAIGHYESHPPSSKMAVWDLASTYQRKAVALVKSSRLKDANSALTVALSLADSVGIKLELSLLLRSWIARSLTITPERVLTEQRRLRYFSVRNDTIGLTRHTQSVSTESDAHASEKGSQCSTIAS